eukprot:12458881-Ditylum_brightwellii.AAC.1
MLRKIKSSKSFKQSKSLKKLICLKEWDKAIERCKSHSKEANIRSRNEHFYEAKYGSDVIPLHQACALKAPVALVETLVASFPGGVKSKDSSFDRLPLHIALQNKASKDVIRALLAFYPQGLQEKDKHDRLPLHYAIANDASEEIIELMVDEFPEGCCAADKKGWLPIHVVCQPNKDSISIKLIEIFLQANPFGAMTKTNSGNTPAMLAKKNAKNAEEIIALLDDKM